MNLINTLRKRNLLPPKDEMCLLIPVGLFALAYLAAMAITGFTIGILFAALTQ